MHVFNKNFKMFIMFNFQGQNNWKSDEEFGNQRLSGCNPTSIELCQKVPEK